MATACAAARIRGLLVADSALHVYIRYLFHARYPRISFQYCSLLLLLYASYHITLECSIIELLR